MVDIEIFSVDLEYIETLLMQKNRVFHITTLIIPKQESTSDSVSFFFGFRLDSLMMWSVNFLVRNLEAYSLLVAYNEA